MRKKAWLGASLCFVALGTGSVMLEAEQPKNSVGEKKIVSTGETWQVKARTPLNELDIAVGAKLAAAAGYEASRPQT